MSKMVVAYRKTSPPIGWRTTLVAILTTAAIAAITVLAAALMNLSQTSGDGRLPHPEPAPAPVRPR